MKTATASEPVGMAVVFVLILLFVALIGASGLLIELIEEWVASFFRWAYDRWRAWRQRRRLRKAADVILATKPGTEVQP